MQDELAYTGDQVARLMRTKRVTIQRLAMVVAGELGYRRPRTKMVRRWRSKGVKAGIWAWEFETWLERAAFGRRSEPAARGWVDEVPAIGEAISRGSAGCATHPPGRRLQESADRRER
jgi:hypothetical protein